MEVKKMKTASKLSVTMVLAIIISIFVSGVCISQEMSEKEYNKYLLKALKDDNVGIRASAAQLLGERKVDEAIKPLARMLKTEKHYAVRIMAALALYQIGTNEVLPILKQRLKRDRNKTVRHVLAGIIDSMETTKYAKK